MKRNLTSIHPITVISVATSGHGRDYHQGQKGVPELLVATAE